MRMNNHTIEAIFFDFGGVVARFDREAVRRMEERHGLGGGDLLKTVYGIPEWEEVQVGRLPDDVWLAAVRRKFDELAGRPVPDLMEEWRHMWSGLDADVVALAEQLRGRYRVG